MDLNKLESYKENNRLEAKAAQGGIPKSIWESVCAFANTSGGLIVLGVKERKDGTLEIVGLSDAHKMLDDFWNAALSKDKMSARFLNDEDAAADEDFLQFIGAARRDKEGQLHPTRAGIFMFGQDCWITHEFPNYFLDYRQETSSQTRWEDRFTSNTGDWSGNIYDFYIKVYNKLKAALKVPFKLEGIERADDAGERAGSGISKIMQGWRDAGYASPRYTERYGPNRTALILPLAPVSAEKNRQILLQCELGKLLKTCKGYWSI